MNNTYILAVCESRTDKLYLQKSITMFYSIEKRTDVKVTYLPLGTKTKACNAEKKIQPILNMAKGSYQKYHIVYVMDRDYPNANKGQEILNTRIKKYCEDRDYLIAWMNPDIENVYLGKTVNDTDKTRSAKKYYRKELLYKEKEALKKKLSSNCAMKGCSNLFTILDPLLSA